MTDVKKPIDRRRDPRVRSMHLVSYEAHAVDPTASPLTVGRTLDVSATGLRVETALMLGLGQELDLEIAVGEQVVEAKGRVVHAAEAGGSTFVTGVEFTDIAPEDLEFLLAE